MCVCSHTIWAITPIKIKFFFLLLIKKKNEILPFVTIWMDLEGITLSETSQIKTNVICYYLYVKSKNK